MCLERCYNIKLSAVKPANVKIGIVGKSKLSSGI